MKNLLFSLCVSVVFLYACSSDGSQGNDSAASAGSSLVGQSGVVDETSSPNIVQVASGSKDHSTLVAAVKAAGLVDALSNTGPFTVFAPVNSAFENLPPGTVEGLLKPEQKETLQDILEYHTYVGILKIEYFKDQQIFDQVNSKKIRISIKDGKVFVNETAEILTSIPTSNGIIHVISEVLLP